MEGKVWVGLADERWFRSLIADVRDAKVTPGG